MAESEYETSCDPSEFLHRKRTSGATLAKAVDLFVMTKFENCLQVCCDVIQVAKDEPEQERNHEVLEAATALGIQALAELDQWHQTVSFITEVYGAIHLCSARIIQVCILLHAHVEEFLPCHKLVQIWLNHPDNLNNKHCAQVIRVYGQHILLPLGQFGVLEEIVNNCQYFSKEEKAALLEIPQAGRYKDAKSITVGTKMEMTHPFFSSEKELSESETFEASQNDEWSCPNRNHHSRPSNNSSRKPVNSIKGTDPLHLLTVCRNLYCRFLGYLKHSWREKFILIIMAVFAIWALVHTQTGDPVSSLGRVVILWQGFLQRIKLYTKNQ
ncbi:mitochondrial ribosomal protein var1 [Plakobranchus ocellatus]|uniref:Mitochondrial ribosomal protein var1 n=1 Tax=Plakobranchus ocellatus TaxID=259542 RepID=A0AAV3YQ00_9GAST|nr:mitochondrial ribosomal protein var1 [Plakobranchus ocellatus]